MEPVFSTFAASRPYTAFKQQLTMIALFLPKETVNHFSALSRYFNNLLNNPKSDFGRMFWKTLAVKNDGIKAFKSNRINYKFKQIMKVFTEIKKKVKIYKVPRWQNHSTCENCGKRCYPDNFELYRFNDRYDRFCNCEFVNCESKVRIIERNIAEKKQAIAHKRSYLHYQLQRLDERMEDLFEKEENVNSIRHLEKMKPALQNMKQNGHYKSTRTQAGKALKELEEYDSWLCRVRRNVNYNALLGCTGEPRGGVAPRAGR